MSREHAYGFPKASTERVFSATIQPTRHTITPELDCLAIAGSANNQLEAPADADRLGAAGILYAPDFVVNAGGIINIAAEQGGYDIDKAAHMVDAIHDNLTEIFDLADRLGVGTERAATQVAENRIAAAAAKGDSP